MALIGYARINKKMCFGVEILSIIYTILKNLGAFNFDAFPAILEDLDFKIFHGARPQTP